MEPDGEYGELHAVTNAAISKRAIRFIQHSWPGSVLAWFDALQRHLNFPFGFTVQPRANGRMLQ